MRARHLLAACGLALLSFAMPASADPVHDVLATVDATLYDAYGDAEAIADGVVSTNPPPPPTTLTYNTDYIIITDWGSGPTFNYHGVFGNPSLWTCGRTYGNGAPVRVTCQANPSSGLRWQCGVMHVNANALSRPVDVYDWTSEYVRETLASAAGQSDAPALPRPPDHRRLRWGRAAGLVSCDGDTMVTAQANQQTPHTNATRTMGAVTTFVCEARLSPTSATAPVTPYSVNCDDPVNPLG